MADQSSMMRYMANPRAFTLKKWLSDLLKERYVAHDMIVDRIGTCLTTDQDLTDFGKLVGDIYETAYKKAVADYREQFEKLGVTVNITTGA